MSSFSGRETWLSGRKRFFAKEVSLKRAPWVRIPSSPPFDALRDAPLAHGRPLFFNLTKSSKSPERVECPEPGSREPVETVEGLFPESTRSAMLRLLMAGHFV